MRKGTPYKDTITEEKDWTLVEKIIGILRDASQEAGGVIAAQSAKALELIASSRNGNAEDCEGESCKIAIPYFGTISIGAGKNFTIPKPSQMQLPTPPNSHLGYNSSSATPTASCSHFTGTSDPSQQQQSFCTNIRIRIQVPTQRISPRRTRLSLSILSGPCSNRP